MGDLGQDRIKEIILDWERKLPVDEWQIQGVHIWPFVRIKLYFFLLNLKSGKVSPPEFKEPVSKSKLNKLLDGAKRALQAKVLLFSFYNKLDLKKIVFFGSHFHRTLQNGIYFNRFFDPMVDAYNLHDEVYMVEFERIYDKNYNQQAIIPLHQYLDGYKLLKKFEGLYKSRKSVSSQLPSFHIFYNELTHQFPSIRDHNISIEGLEHWAEKINRTKGFFAEFFRKTKPEKIIFLSYYGYDDLAAAILAANDMGIKTIDFQHGPQTNVHMAYSSWTKQPESFYNIMPLEYWTWDERSKKNIEEWTQKSKYIRVKNYGHPYLSHFRNEVLERNADNEVLFSLQTLHLDEMIPPVMLEIIRESNLYWIFRMHPRSNLSTQELNSFLAHNKISKNIYRIESSVHSPLPQSLAAAKFHVTNFSGCVIEAGILNIPSIIIHESGREIFKSYIDNKNVFFLDMKEPGVKDEFQNILNRLPETSLKQKFQAIQNPLD